MRKSLFLILLATAAMPALAAPNQGDRGGDRRAARAEHSESTKEQKAQRPQRAERSSRAKPAQQQAPAANVQRTQRNNRGIAVVDRPQRTSRSGGQRTSRYSGQVSGDNSRRVVSQNTTNRSSRYSGQYSGQYSGRGTRSGTNWGIRTPTNQTNTGVRSTSSRYRDGDRNRDGNRYRDGSRDRDGRRWSGDWRRDNRYDWRHHRNRYSSIYRLGRYHDPFGYGYRRFSIGLFLGAGYYGNNYWLNDPWQYRLPPAYGPYRWVRYYNDALLVDIYSGEVVDVIYGFFL